MPDPAKGQMRTVISTEQIQKRVRELARQISVDYRDKTVHVLAVLENSFIFTADLVRAMEVPVICQFIKPRYSSKTENGAAGVLEIFFSQGPDIKNQHVLLVEGVVHSGITTEFLMSDFRSGVAASVKLVSLAVRQPARRVPLQPDYFGFLVDETVLTGYGMGSAEQTGRNLPYLATGS